MVFDKDDYPDFDEAIELAKKNGFEVAYSNQAFELWFLLHFKKYSGKLHRREYPIPFLSINSANTINTIVPNVKINAINA